MLSCAENEGQGEGQGTEGARVRQVKPAILEAPRKPATCATSCYELEAGRWIHHPWDGCTTIKPESGEQLRKVQETCWHCRGEKKCGCIACPGQCAICKGSGRVWRWIQ